MEAPDVVDGGEEGVGGDGADAGDRAQPRHAGILDGEVLDRRVGVRELPVEGAHDGEMLTWKVNGQAVANARWISNLIGLFSDLRWENNAAKQIELDAVTTAVQLHSWTDVKEAYRR